MNKTSQKQRGFSIVELLIGVSIGIIVLTGLLSFFFRTSKMISGEQNSAKRISQVQFVLNMLAEDIKESNSQAPSTGSTVTPANWAALPYMTYFRIFDYSGNFPILQPPDTTFAKEFPTYPVAYVFNSQAGQVGLPNGWFPKPTVNTSDPQFPESNQLAFYKVVGNQISRVLYYTEEDPNPDYALVKSWTNTYARPERLRRIQQTGILSTSTNFIDTTITTSRNDILLSNVKAIQFTYPVLTQRLSNTLDPLYISVNTATDPTPAKIPYLQSGLMNTFRNIIGIKILMAGQPIGNNLSTAFELNTEVNVRN